MPGTNEAFSRVKIDAQLKDQGWDVLNPNAVRFEYVLPDKTKVIERLEELNLLLPPLEAQRAFAQRLALLESVQIQQRTAHARPEATFNALLSGIFSRCERGTDVVQREVALA